MGKISKKQKEEILQKMIERGKQIASQSKEEISDCYLDEVNRFYNEEVFLDDNGEPTNVPKIYKRHQFSSIEQSGMGRTFEPFEESGKKGKDYYFKGGINVNTSHMYHDYQDSAEDVLSSFIEGFHGPIKSKNPIRGDVRPVEHTREFVRNDLIKRVLD